MVEGMAVGRGRERKVDLAVKREKKEKKKRLMIVNEGAGIDKIVVADLLYGKTRDIEEVPLSS